MDRDPAAGACGAEAPSVLGLFGDGFALRQVRHRYGFRSSAGLRGGRDQSDCRDEAGKHSAGKQGFGVHELEKDHLRWVDTRCETCEFHAMERG